MAAHAFDFSIYKAEAGVFPRVKSIAWSTEQVPGQPRLTQRDPVLKKTKPTDQSNKKNITF